MGVRGFVWIAELLDQNVAAGDQPARSPTNRANAKHPRVTSFQSSIYINSLFQ